MPGRQMTPEESERHIANALRDERDTIRDVIAAEERGEIKTTGNGGSLASKRNKRLQDTVRSVLFDVTERFKLLGGAPLTDAERERIAREVVAEAKFPDDVAELARRIGATALSMMAAGNKGEARDLVRENTQSLSAMLARTAYEPPEDDWKPDISGIARH
jgi:hypothetical protein